MVQSTKLQNWVEHTGEKVVVIFEGRDSAGKGGVIKRTTQRLNPRVVRFATPDQVEQFFQDVPEFERMLVRSGIRLINDWFSVPDEEQITLPERVFNPDYEPEHLPEQVFVRNHDGVSVATQISPSGNSDMAEHMSLYQGYVIKPSCRGHAFGSNLREN